MTDETYQTYIFEYPYKGRRWGFEIMATSPEDAEARFKALQWGEYQGRLIASVDVPNLFDRIWKWLRTL